MLTILLLAASILDLGAVTEGEIYRVLKERHIPFDADAVHKSAVEAMIKAIDPRAKILSREDAVKLLCGDTIEKAEEWPEGICYLKLNGLYEGGGDKVTQRLKTWAEAGQSGVIVDIRDAGGNSLSAIDEIAGLFIPGNTVLYKIKDCRDRVIETYKTKEGLPSSAEAAGGDARPLNNMPLMLIIDDETCDASEIMASVLKRQRGVMLIGAPTRGDSNLREVILLSGDEVLYMSTRQIVLPDAASYSPDGVQPDIAVSKTAEEKKSGQPSQDIPGEGRGHPLSDKEKLDRELVSHVMGDAVLGRAVDILLGLKALAEPEHAAEKNEKAENK